MTKSNTLTNSTMNSKSGTNTTANGLSSRKKSIGATSGNKIRN